MTEDIAALLVAEGVVDAAEGGADAWPVKRDTALPAQPDRVVMLTTTPGFQVPRTSLMRPGLQVRIRGKKWESDEVLAKFAEIDAHLDRRPAGEVNGHYYGGIIAGGSAPTFMGVDESNRPEFVRNYDVHRKREA